MLFPLCSVFVGHNFHIIKGCRVAAVRYSFDPNLISGAQRKHGDHAASGGGAVNFPCGNVIVSAPFRDAFPLEAASQGVTGVVT